MKLLFFIATKQLLARKRQGIVSLLGIVLGVAFFLAVASLMIGSEADFIRRLVDNSPHITIVDEFRMPKSQPVDQVFSGSLISLSNVTPLNETRGVRNYQEIINFLRKYPDTRASASLVGQVLVSYAGKDYGLTLNGMIPSEIRGITTIEEYMVDGSIDDLIGYPEGVVIGQELARKLVVKTGDVIPLTASNGTVKSFKILGLFRTGRANFDESQAFVDLSRAQSLLDRARRANRILVKFDQPYVASQIAEEIEGRFQFKSVSWQEASEDILNTLTIRNTIMYTVVSAVLIVAAFGIYNVISTVVKEKYRDIAILKSMGFHSSDIQKIFVIQGVILGICGCSAGLPLGCGLMYALMQVKFKPPGGSQVISMPIDWGLAQFLIAIFFAMAASLLAAYLPARHAGGLKPVSILRGGW